MEYDEGYYDEYEDDEFEDEDVDDEQSYAEEWIAELFNGMEKLERRKGRELTGQEVDGIVDQVADQNDTYPDIDKAYEDYYAESGKNEYDLGSNQSRREYMADLLDDADRELKEQQEEEAEAEEAHEEAA